MFSRVLPKSLPQSVLAPWSAVLIAGFPKVWANIPRLLVDPFVLESRLVRAIPVPARLCKEASHAANEYS